MIKNTLLTSSVKLASSTAAAMVAATVAATAVAGAPASLMENRGYERCLAAAQEQSPSLNVVKDYFINEGADGRTYYLNGYAVYEGAWSAVRISCDTTTSGHRLMTMTLEPGHYAGVRTQTTAVAQY